MAKRAISVVEDDACYDDSLSNITISDDDEWADEYSAAQQAEESNVAPTERPKSECRNLRMAPKVRNKMEPISTSGQMANFEDFDVSDDENIRNTTGNIPVEWYRNYDHIGYDSEGKKIMKAKRKDEVEEFLTQVDNPYYWRTVEDKMTAQNVVLTDNDIEVIKRMSSSRYCDVSYNPHEPFSDFFTHETMLHPVTNRPETKASFIPSLGEKKAISRLVFRIKRAKYLNIPKPEKKVINRFIFNHDLWENETQPNKRMLRHIPAPKMKLPTHEESYNPPSEYLFTEKELEDWNNTESERRKLNFIPKKYEKLRHVPWYSDFVKDRFERCLDLYMCPRVRKLKANVDPADLIPALPKPRDLQPFPSQLSLTYTGHSSCVRCITVEPSGQYLASGSDDKTIRIWEVLTTRCVRTITFNDEISSVAWCPESAKCVCLVVSGKNVFLINPQTSSHSVVVATDLEFQKEFSDVDETSTASLEKSFFSWQFFSQNVDDKLWSQGIRGILKHQFDVKQIAWHYRGDYFATVMRTAARQAVAIHQLSRRRSQIPFKKSKGLIECVLFHPSKPFLFVATQRYIRIYNLVKQELIKKLLCNCKHVSSMAIHPGGDNLIIGSYDLRLSWFDLDLSDKPYKTLRYHKKAIRKVNFHSRFPLFASASEDGTVIVTHSMVYSDLTQNALIVPVKLLRPQTLKSNNVIYDCCFHPLQPWLFCCGSENTIRLFT